MVCGCGEGGLSADSACQDACGHCVMFCLPSCGIFTKYQRKQTWQDHLVLISFILRGFKRGGVCCAVVICGMMSRCGYMAWMCWWHNIYNVAMCGEVCCGVALVVVCAEMWEKPAGRPERDWNVSAWRKEARGAAAASRQCSSNSMMHPRQALKDVNS